MEFTWSVQKNLLNQAKHGISFEEAQTAFYDPLSRTIPDSSHSQKEERLLLIGMAHRGSLLVVSHTDHDEVIRIISARVATRCERWTYEET
jgi:uncharacterized DUF497 family protein